MSITAKKPLLFLLLALLCSQLRAHEYDAFIVKPVVDLLGQPLSQAPKKGLTLEQYYYHQPFSGSWKACARCHQLLFNEVVTVIEERGKEVKVRISSFYYLKDNESTLYDSYWMLKKDLKPLNEKSRIPPQISYKEKKFYNCRDESVITLKKPFYSDKLKKTFSAGTRFLACPSQDFSGSFDKGCFKVYAYNTSEQKETTIAIPKTHCIRNYSTSKKDRVNNFVQVLKSWCYQKNGFIPYVLGGWSWTESCSKDEYTAHYDTKKEQVSYLRPEWKKPVKEGFDCMGVIGRAAQICEIPFFCKNTSTLLKKLSPVSKFDTIKEGDIVWYPGHVLVVSDTQKNLLIEARGYENGRGKVKEVPVHEVFQGVSSFKELKKHLIENTPVVVLDHEGKVYKKFKRFKVLKLDSVWPS